MTVQTKNTMRLIGVLGGMSPESTILYYRFMNDAVRKATGDPEASARLVMHCVDFAHLAQLQRAGKWEEAGIFLAEAARGLVRAGAELLVISANTMHICAEAVASANPSVPLVHIGDAIVKEAGRGAKVLLLGTKYTMEMPFLSDYIRARHISTDVPDADVRGWIQETIYNELARSIVRAETKTRFLELLKDAKRKGFDAVVLGCTELGMLVDDDAPIPLIDTARAHAQAAVDAALIVRKQ